MACLAQIHNFSTLTDYTLLFEQDMLQYMLHTLSMQQQNQKLNV